MIRRVNGSSSSLTHGKYRCDALGCFKSDHARRSENSKKSRSAPTASRFRCGLRSVLRSAKTRSRGDFLQHHLAKTQISHQLLESGVFLFEVFELAGLIGLEPAILIPPAVVSLLGDPELA